MESNNEFQLLKLKVASEIVRSSQSVVAFSRAFYLEEVLIDKIRYEVKDTTADLARLQDKIETLLKSAHLEDNIVTETNLRLLCSTIQSELDGHFNGSMQDVWQDWEKRVIQAEARRQAKSKLLQELSSNELVTRFESLTLRELREIHVPEFSCFINESDFGQLEQFNEEWSQFRKGLLNIVKDGWDKIELFRVNDRSSYRNLHNQFPHPQGTSTISEFSIKTFNGTVEQDGLDEIGKTFANRSGNVLRKFSSLLRRGNRKSKTLSLSHDSFDEKGEP